MFKFDFNENQKAKRPSVLIAGFSESYRRMLEVCLAGEFVFDGEPDLIISDGSVKLTKRDVPHIIIGDTEGRKKNNYYLRRPIVLAELCRLAASLITSEAPLQSAELTFDSGAFTVGYQGKAAQLTQLEFSLFMLLYEKRGEIISRGEICSSLWPDECDSNVCDVYVCYLRKKLSPLLGHGCITSVRGKGYVLLK